MEMLGMDLVGMDPTIMPLKRWQQHAGESYPPSAPQLLTTHTTRWRIQRF